MAKRVLYVEGGAKEVKRLRKNALVIAKNLIRNLKRGDCRAADGDMHQLDRIQAMVVNYTKGRINDSPFLPSKGTVFRLRRAHANRCRVGRFPSARPSGV